MNPKLKTLKMTIENFMPTCEQEEWDRAAMLRFLSANDDCLDRSSLTAHFTASAWIINEAENKVLMVYHNIYDSWSWTGGHADGEADLAGVALREAVEETGAERIDFVSREPISLEIITVDGHEKRGAYVPSHLHLNLTYLLKAEEGQSLTVKTDENSGVRWIEADRLAEFVSEPWMLERIYSKLMNLHKQEKDVCRNRLC